MHILSLFTSLLAALDPTATPSALGDTPVASGLKVVYDDVLHYALDTLIFVANVAGGLVVGVGTVRGLLTYVRDLLGRATDDVPREAIRLSLGRSLALALEFQLGADILETALNPSLHDIATLAAIVVLRTVLNFFLGRELADASKRGETRSGTAQSQAPVIDHT